MASLIITIDDNDIVKKYTKETDINSMSIKAQPLNLLPVSYWMDKIIIDGLDGAYIKYDDYIHYDYNTYATGANKVLFGVMFYTKPNVQYTFSFKIFNLTGNDDGVGWNLYVNNADTNVDIMENNEIYTYTFTATSNVTYINLLHQGSLVHRDCEFDLQLLGLIEGDEPIAEITRKFQTAPSVYASNQDNIVGEYVISRYAYRRFKAIEDRIINSQTLFDITWR